MIAAYLLDELACITPRDERTHVVLRERGDGPEEPPIRDIADVVRPNRAAIGYDALVPAVTRILGGPRMTARQVVEQLRMRSVDVSHTTMMRTLNRMRKHGLVARSRRRICGENTGLGGSFFWWVEKQNNEVAA